MTDDPALDFATLMCSRLCHDLISPVGAIGNGVELLQAELGPSDDVALVADSAQAAQAALAFYRVAFGAADAEARAMSTGELGRLASAHYRRSRLSVEWPATGEDLPRPAARLLLLTMMAAAASAPLGGVARVAPPSAAPLALSVRVEGRRAGLPPAAEALLRGGGSPEDGRGAAFALAGRCAAAMGARYVVEQDEGTVAISLSGR